MKKFIETPRLILRQWKEDDKAIFAKMNTDSEVMQYFPSTSTEEESNSFADKMKTSITEKGFGLFAAEHKGTGHFIGFIGLNEPNFEAHFTPCTEIGWRLDKNFWNQGLATEGARAVANFAFEKLKLDEIVSFTSILNKPSIRVMQKIRMINKPEDNFTHPKLPMDHKLALHVLYRLNSKHLL